MAHRDAADEASQDRPAPASNDPERTLATLGGGADQAGGRAYNERLALSLIRLNGPLAKAELARLTGLSAQTMSLLIRRLEADGLVVAQAPLRGRIGQPSVPYALNPGGAYAFGVKIGRRSADVVLCDFHGRIVARAKQTYAFPAPQKVFDFVANRVGALRAGLPREARYSGVGVATPFELWKWAEVVEAPKGALEGWRDMDVAAELGARLALPCHVANDASAACGAELATTWRGSTVDLLYFFVGSFVGGGVALNGALVQGRTGNAGALGSMPVTIAGRRSQLIEHASLITLERAVAVAGGDVSLLQRPDADWSAIRKPLARWTAQAAKALAGAIVAGASVIDFSRICIDGALPRAALGDLVEATRLALADHDLQGLSPFEITAGALGADARALGAAMLPMTEHYGCGQDVLLKKTAA